MDDLDLFDSGDLSNYFGSTASPFDTNAGVNLPAAQSTAPVIATPGTNGSPGTSAVSPSFLSQIGSLLTSAAPVASTVASTLTGKTTTTPAKTTTSSTLSSITSSPMLLIGLIGGAILLVVLLLRKR